MVATLSKDIYDDWNMQMGGPSLDRPNSMESPRTSNPLLNRLRQRKLEKSASKEQEHLEKDAEELPCKNLEGM